MKASSVLLLESNADPESYCLAKIVQAEMNLEAAKEVKARYIKVFKRDFPGASLTDI